jgi:chaperone modulatory protein CbpM
MTDGTVIEELTLVEISELCAVEVTVIVALVDEGVLEPRGPPGEWRFPGEALRRATQAVRLQRDLGLNTAGVALALELLDEIAALRARGG